MLLEKVSVVTFKSYASDLLSVAHLDGHAAGMQCVVTGEALVCLLPSSDGFVPLPLHI